MATARNKIIFGDINIVFIFCKIICYNDSMSGQENKIDFLAIGDTVIDAFIKLKDASIVLVQFILLQRNW